MAGRSQIPLPSTPCRSVRRLVTDVRTTAQRPPPCPGLGSGGSRLPQPSGRVCVTPARAARQVCVAPARTTPVCRPPAAVAGGSGLRPPRVCVRSPEPATICVSPARSPSPPRQRARSPSPPRPWSPVEGSDNWREWLMAGEPEQHAAEREALRAYLAARMAAWSDTAEEQQRRAEAEARKQAAILQEVRRRYAEESAALRELDAKRAAWLRARREIEQQRAAYQTTLEGIEERLMRQRDCLLAQQEEQILRRIRPRVTSASQWAAALNLAAKWRRDELEEYRPYARAEAKLTADKQMYEKRRARYRRKVKLRHPPMSPVEEAQVDVFDDSPPCGLPPPMLPRRPIVQPSCACAARVLEFDNLDEDD